MKDIEIAHPIEHLARTPKLPPSPRAGSSPRIFVLIAALSILLAGCGIPHDPADTLERVRGGTMRVGVIDNPPWAALTDTGAVGVEARLVRELADELDARIEWVPGGESDLLDALEHYRLDLVIGGLTRASPWSSHLAFTTAYHTAPITVGVPPGTPAIRDLSGLEVAVEPGSVTAEYLEERDATPITVAEPARYNGPVAAPEWELSRWGFQSTGIVLYRERHVLAAPPGENGWLVYLERFLRARRPAASTMLQEGAQGEEHGPATSCPLTSRICDARHGGSNGSRLGF